MGAAVAATAAAAAAAGLGTGSPCVGHHSGGLGKLAGTVTGGVADRAHGLEGPLGPGAAGDSILEGRKWG